MMDPKVLTPDEVPAFIVDLVNLYVPCDQGDDKFTEIAKGYVYPYGTTCGFLVQWALWRSGCRNPKIVNREEPDDGLKFHNGMNLAMLWNNGRAPFEMWTPDMEFEPGDILYISDLLNVPQHNPNTEHVFIYMGQEQRDDGLYMLSADGGQRNAKNQECMRMCARLWHGRNIGKSGRKLVGRLSPRKLTYTAQAYLWTPDNPYGQ